MKKKILITGVAGFIGFHVAKSLSNIEIFGIDNLNEYYDVKLKKDRIKQLNKKNNFQFYKIDLYNKIHELEKIFSQNNFDYIIHLAAQAGVRYSLENPISYINNNILASVNLLELLVKYKFDGHLVVASTSSVYGERTEGSFSEFDKTNAQISLYSASKKSLESITHSYSYNFKFKTTVLRFFTVYGPWGRPDMALFKFVKAMINEKSFNVFNKGEMWRDFTYIDDLVESINRLLLVPPVIKDKSEIDSISNVAPYRIVNIGNQKLVKLNDIIKLLEKILKKKALVNYLPMQKGDVPYTLSNSELLFELTGFKPSTPIENGLIDFCEWFKEYYD